MGLFLGLIVARDLPEDQHGEEPAARDTSVGGAIRPAKAHASYSETGSR